MANVAHYSISTYHGEGKSLFHVVDNTAPQDEQPCVVSSHKSRDEAESALFALVMDEQRRLAEVLPVDICEESIHQQRGIRP